VPPILTSGSVISFSSTDIVTDGVNREVVASSSSHLQLFLTLSFDLSQVRNWTDLFIANFQMENYQTGAKINTYWNAPLSALPQAASIWLLEEGPASAFGLATPGLYLYRPTFTIVSANPRELPAFIGLSHFAVAEEHYLILEGTP
jgi:hypothetical protein